MRKYILIQARLSSSRFPRKMLHTIGKMTLVEYVYNRCKQVKNIDGVVVITSNEKSDDELYKLCYDKNMLVFRGSLNDVLKRYIDASNYYNADFICRVCGDSPFVDIKAIEKEFLEIEKNNNIEYISTINSLNGFMSEVFSLNLLKKIYDFDLTVEDKEHVTKYIRDNISKFNTKKIDLKLKPKELEKYTLTVDYPNDINIISKIAIELKNFNFTSQDVIKILKKLKKLKGLK